MIRLAIVLVTTVACGNSKSNHESGDETKPAAAPPPATAAPPPSDRTIAPQTFEEARWVRACHESPSEVVYWQQAHLIVAETASRTWKTRQPQHLAEVTGDYAKFHQHMAVARARVAAGVSATGELDQALQAAGAIGKDYRRDRALVFGARWLQRHGMRGLAAEWSSRLTTEHTKQLWKVYRAIDEAQQGHGDAAVAALEALPATWSKFTDPSDWRGYDPFIAGQATAVCVALQREWPAGWDKVPALLRSVEKKLEGTKNDWQARGQWHALALAWTRVAKTTDDFTTAIRAAARMNEASGRAELLGRIVLAATSVSGVDVAKLEVIAAQASRAPADKPLVVGDDPEALEDFVALASHSPLTVGLVRTALAQKDLATAARIAASIPTNLADRDTANGLYVCALFAAEPAEAARQEARLRPTNPALLPAYYMGYAFGGCNGRLEQQFASAPGLASRVFIDRTLNEGLADATVAVAKHLAHGGTFGAGEADALENALAGLIELRRLEDAAALLLSIKEVILQRGTNHRIATQAHRLVVELAGAGNTELAAKMYHHATTVLQ